MDLDTEAWRSLVAWHEDAGGLAAEDLPDIDFVRRLLRDAEVDRHTLRVLLGPLLGVEQLDDHEVLEAVGAMLTSGLRPLVRGRAVHADTSRRPDESEAAWAEAPLLSDLLPRHDAPAPLVRPTWFEVVVFGELGTVVEDAVLTIRFPDGSTRSQPLDATGRFRADDIALVGLCDVSLQVPIRLAPPPIAPGLLPEPDALVAHDRPTVVPLSTTRLHRIAVTRPRVCVVELQDAAFDTGGKLLRPDARPGEDSAVAGGLRSIAAALERAFADPTVRLWVAGHADTVGDDEDNAALSQERAINVQLFVSGQADAWGAHCQAHYTIGDFEAAYRFVACTFGWDCDPGRVDDDFDDASRDARDRFRRRYTAETGTPLQRHVKQNETDWAAIFAMYQRALAQTMGIAIDDLVSRCAALEFVDPSTVGCGERFPKQAIDQDGFASAANRRVDILLFAHADVDFLGAPPEPARVYGATRMFRRIGVYVPKGDEALEELVSQLVDEEDNPVPGERYELTLPDGTMIEGRGDSQGFVRVPGVPVGMCRLVYPDLDAREWSATPIGPRPLPPADLGETHAEPEDDLLPAEGDDYHACDGDERDDDLDGEIPPDPHGEDDDGNAEET